MFHSPHFHLKFQHSLRFANQITLIFFFVFTHQKNIAKAKPNKKFVFSPKKKKTKNPERLKIRKNVRGLRSLLKRSWRSETIISDTAECLLNLMKRENRFVSFRLAQILNIFRHRLSFHCAFVESVNSRFVEKGRQTVEGFLENHLKLTFTVGIIGQGCNVSLFVRFVLLLLIFGVNRTRRAGRTCSGADCMRR